MKVGIIGLGLMGGSLGLALKKFSKEYQIIGYDHNQSHQKEALELKLIDQVTNSLDIIKKCDVIILTIPVDAIISTISDLTDIDKECTVIDFGSSKEKISNAIPSHVRQNFVTAHPMTGTENFGPSAAIDNLYQNKTMVICDSEKSGELQKSIAIKIFNDINSKIIYMNSKEHDRHAAFISHMPHAVSYAIANAVMKQEDSSPIVALAGGGFKSMTRIAQSSPNMWEDIFRQNKDNILKSIITFNKEMLLCQELIENEEWYELHIWMKKANTLHEIL